MDSKTRLRYYLLILCFPLFIVLHGLNEYPGLMAIPAVGKLAVNYILIALGVGVVSELIFREFSRALAYACLLLTIFFFFGVLKDFTDRYDWLKALTPYRFMLPGIAALTVLAAILLKRLARPPARFARLLATLLVVFIVVESASFAYGYLIAGPPDHGLTERDKKMIENIRIPPGSPKPFVFWIISDEYSASSVMKERWGYDNPLDSLLRGKGFFVADSAMSAYNNTLYSVNSILHMRYVDSIRNHSIVNYADAALRRQQLKDNPVVEVFRRNGYAIENHAIYDLKDHPTAAVKEFYSESTRLINDQTLFERTRRDIGWGLTHILSGNKAYYDSVDMTQSLIKLVDSRNKILKESLRAAQRRRDDPQPAFFMFHLMYTHAPFIFKADGSFDFSTDWKQGASKYAPNIHYSNQIINNMIDSIMSMYEGRDFVIILQGDHGFKFAESDPLFESASCKILYAVYCSDKDYAFWDHSVNAVNSFRLLFNKYFDARLPLLPGMANNIFPR